MVQPFLPYGRHWIDEDDIAAVTAALRSDWLTTGPRVEQFEGAFAEAVGARFAVACVNATAALHLAALAGGMGKDDVGIAPTMSFLASANGMRYAGSDIVFIDADPDSGLVTPQTFKDAIARAARPPKMAVIVHLNGQPARMPEIAGIARQYRIALVEDACHAIGSAYPDEAGEMVAVGACRHSAMAVFSLHPVKTITMGEGGVITTNDRALDERLRLYRSHGMIREPAAFSNADMGIAADGSANPWYYEMQELGYNYRAPDIICALGQSQLAKLQMFSERRAELKRAYDKQFAGISGVMKPVTMRDDARLVLHLYPVLTDFDVIGKSRATVMSELRQRGIGTQVHYIPIHHQPYYAHLGMRPGLPGADAYYRRVISLPFFPRMDERDVERVASEIKDVLAI